MEHYKNRSLENISEVIDGVLVTEMWKDIKDCEGYYMISSFGRVKSLARLVDYKGRKSVWKGDMILAQQLNFGYLIVKMMIGKKQITRSVHRLVGEAFISNPENKETINHKNGVKSDNRVSQLEWNTYKENNIHSYAVLKRKPTMSGGAKGAKHKSSKAIVCINTSEIFESIRQAAIILGFKSHRSIQAVLSGVHKDANGLVFKYLSDYRGDEKVEDINSHLRGRSGMVGSTHPMFGKRGADVVNSKLVLDTQTGIFYECAREAAEAKNIGYSYAKSMLNGTLKNKTSLIYV